MTRKELERDIDQYLKNGGKIQKCDASHNLGASIGIKCNEKGDPRYTGKHRGFMSSQIRGGSR